MITNAEMQLRIEQLESRLDAALRRIEQLELASARYGQITSRFEPIGGAYAQAIDPEKHTKNSAASVTQGTIGLIGRLRTPPLPDEGT